MPRKGLRTSAGSDGGVNRPRGRRLVQTLHHRPEMRLSQTRTRSHRSELLISVPKITYQSASTHAPVRDCSSKETNSNTKHFRRLKTCPEINLTLIGNSYFPRTRSTCVTECQRRFEFDLCRPFIRLLTQSHIHF